MKTMKILLFVDQVCGWAALALVIVYMLSGFSLAGQFGMERVISIRYSHYIHNNLHVPLLVCVLCHGAFRGFVSIRKWKAMKSGKRPAR